jgi:hypothetical protein
MTDDLIRLAELHQRHMGRPPVQETVRFIANVVDVLHHRVPMAHDSLPIGIKATKGDSKMPAFRRRPARDDYFGSGGPGMQPRGGTDQETSFPSKFGEGLKRAGETVNRVSEAAERHDTTEDSDIDAATLLHMVQLCRNGLLSRDQETGGSETADFLAGLVDLLQNSNGMNGDSRRRSARDQLPSGSASARSPMNGVGSYDRRMSRDRRPAQDRALVDQINRSGWEQRWGKQMRHIKFGANGR